MIAELKLNQFYARSAQLSDILGEVQARTPWPDLSGVLSTGIFD
jgi:hypothetical protein